MFLDPRLPDNFTFYWGLIAMVAAVITVAIAAVIATMAAIVDLVTKLLVTFSSARLVLLNLSLAF